jgi:ribosomal protein S18 acetylase RimI-like enzyme
LRVEIGDIHDAEIEAVVELWRRCGLTRPWNDPYADIALAQRSTDATVLVGRQNGAPAAAVMVGHDGHRGWVYYLAVDSHQRRGGRGRAMMAAAEAWLQTRAVPKLQLMVRNANPEVLGFYSALGFVDQEVSVLGKWIDGRSA